MLHSFGSSENLREGCFLDMHIKNLSLLILLRPFQSVVRTIHTWLASKILFRLENRLLKILVRAN